MHIKFPTLIDNVVELLSKATDDTEDLIGYWIFELDFGRKAAELGSDLITVENLWDKLHKSVNNSRKTRHNRLEKSLDF